MNLIIGAGVLVLVTLAGYFTYISVAYSPIERHLCETKSAASVETFRDENGKIVGYYASAKRDISGWKGSLYDEHGVETVRIGSMAPPYDKNAEEQKIEMFRAQYPSASKRLCLPFLPGGSLPSITESTPMSETPSNESPTETVSEHAQPQESDVDKEAIIKDQLTAYRVLSSKDADRIRTFLKAGIGNDPMFKTAESVDGLQTRRF